MSKIKFRYILITGTLLILIGCFKLPSPDLIIPYSEVGVKLTMDNLGTGINPDWSSDGQRIVYVDNGIYIMNIRGKKLQKVANKGNNPAWSPDNNFIAYNDKKGIWIRKLNEKHAYNLVNTGSHPRWSPDGRSIAYTSDGIHIIDVTTKQDTNLTKQGINPEWSPDGRFLLYSELSEDKINFDVYLLNLKSGDRGLLINKASFATWSPDQHYIIFVSEGIYLKSITDGKMKRVTWAGYNPRWSPDGKKILCYFYGNIWVMESPYIINSTISPVNFSSIDFSKVSNSQKAPKILKAISEPSEISAKTGGQIKIVAIVEDPNGLNDIDSVALYYGDTKYHELIGPNDEGAFTLNLSFFPGISPSDFNFEVMAIDKDGYKSNRVPVSFKIK